MRTRVCACMGTYMRMCMRACLHLCECARTLALCAWRALLRALAHAHTGLRTRMRMHARTHARMHAHCTWSATHLRQHACIQLFIRRFDICTRECVHASTRHTRMSSLAPHAHVHARANAPRTSYTPFAQEARTHAHTHARTDLPLAAESSHPAPQARMHTRHPASERACLRARVRRMPQARRGYLCPRVGGCTRGGVARASW